nr:asparaginase [Nocardioides panaciterrulae]
MFTLGGTISMAGDSPGAGVVSRLTGEQLTAAVPGLADLAEPLEIHDVQAAPSASLSFATVLDVVAAASRAVTGGATGVVLTQGTDSMEETAWLVDLVWPHPEPFVVTGAMRNPTLAGPDGPANLLAAVQVAASPEARELGALVVFAEEVHAARWVRKQHSTSTGTFGSPNLGPMGQVVEGVPRILARPSRHAPLPQPAVERWEATRVALHTVVLDDDGLLLERVADTHQGLVVAAFGVGHVPAWLAEPLGELARVMPVVLTSRTGSGSVLEQTYGGPGSEIDLLGRGLLNGGMLDPYKARILLRLLLASGADRERITEELALRG